MDDQSGLKPGGEAGVSRRRLLVGGAAAAGVVGASAWAVAESRKAAEPSTFGAEAVPFYGTHQAGIATSPQSNATFVGLDLVPDGKREAREVLRAVLKLWTTDAARLTQGSAALADTEPELAMRPARLTVTVGFGPALFDKVGLGGLRPPSAQPLPAFSTDRLESRWGATDLMLQICADDPMVVAHATRVLVKNVRTLAGERWRQVGFRTARSAEPDGTTARNLMGQVDGTVNPVAGTPDFDQVVWSDGGAQPWMAGGTLMVLRRIRMNLDAWDVLDRDSKELVVGRRLDNGAPLTGEKENDPVDVTKLRDGIPVIPPNAHVALAHPQLPEQRFLRRPYNYDDPPPAGEVSNSGLIFVAFERDIATQFLPVQQRLAQSDAMNRWITAIGSAVYVIPPGVQPGGFLGGQLFSAAAD
ncbi:MAG TPA: Dyp-type peroxidase [Mycobacterium sp.]|uniref:Dyp-type peroxidase n=1 Tax=Mycolicibacterium sp. TaxID=2320850 RepID=UPI0025D118EC|nr:Dyp-type peroxidase [Mycolicibacterium sp.]HPX38565.1 Dyp-type peroxidase [Mycobacterium sp.]HQC77897.1 Dyp-type peroxidase [Mycobacterium sp.]